MEGSKGVSHRPGPLKQQNKTHKTGRHRSKGEVLKTNKGKVEMHIVGRKNKDAQSKEQRKHRLNQLRRNKRDDIVNKKRCIGSLNGCAHIVTIIPLASDVNCRDVIESLTGCDAQANTRLTDTSSYILESPRFKAKFNLLTPNPNNVNAVMDAIKITDTLLFVISKNENGIDADGDALFQLIYSFNLPTNLFVVQGIKSMPSKAQTSTRDHLQKCLDTKGLDTKLNVLDSDSDSLNLLYKMSQHKLRQATYNELRPYVLAERYEFEPYKFNAKMGTLKVYGYVRGRHLNANSLVHLPSMGTYQLSEIYSLKMRGGEKTKQANGDDDADLWDLVQQADPLVQESLDVEAFVDDMNAEQTWPTEQELKEAETKAVKKKVPKGTSDYQAAWIVDSEEEEEEEDEDDEDDEEDDDEEDDENDDEEDGEADENNNLELDEDDDDEEEETEDEEMETIAVGGGGENDNAKYDDNLDMDEEKRTFAMLKAARTNAQFPDEVDTPMDVAARVRFQKYRGMKSFRTSPWDKYENLPVEYSRIFQFEDIRRTFKKISKETNVGADVGMFVRVHIKNVPASLQLSPGHPLVMYGLLKHENKISVLNLKLKRVNQTDHDVPIKSKEKLVYHVGCRRFEAEAIISQHTSGDKHKMERFMPTDGSSFVSSLFAPITFAPASVLVFKKLADGRLVLVATGCVLNVEPNRIVLKRIVLSGHPFKVSNKNAVCRYMFFNPEDVNWFKPVELRTKYGRRGHIREPLGTHGHMKCQFSDVMKSQDTVLMNLYKRCFPKWTYTDLSNDFLADANN